MWSVGIVPGEPATAKLHFSPDTPDDPEAESYTGFAELFRGAPSWESHPELIHGLKALINAAIHQPYLSPWIWDVPDTWCNAPNVGDARRYLLLEGGRLSWKLVIRFSPRTPFWVFEALAKAFNASQKEEPFHETRRSKRHAAARKANKGIDPSPAEVAT